MAEPNRIQPGVVVLLDIGTSQCKVNWRPATIVFDKAHNYQSYRLDPGTYTPLSVSVTSPWSLDCTGYLQEKILGRKQPIKFMFGLDPNVIDETITVIPRLKMIIEPSCKEHEEAKRKLAKFGKTVQEAFEEYIGYIFDLLKQAIPKPNKYMVVISGYTLAYGAAQILAYQKMISKQAGVKAVHLEPEPVLALLGAEYADFWAHSQRGIQVGVCDIGYGSEDFVSVSAQGLQECFHQIVTGNLESNFDGVHTVFEKLWLFVEPFLDTVSYATEDRKRAVLAQYIKQTMPLLSNPETLVSKDVMGQQVRGLPEKLKELLTDHGKICGKWVSAVISSYNLNIEYLILAGGGARSVHFQDGFKTAFIGGNYGTTIWFPATSSLYYNEVLTGAERWSENPKLLKSMSFPFYVYCYSEADEEQAVLILEKDQLFGAEPNHTNCHRFLLPLNFTLTSVDDDSEDRFELNANFSISSTNVCQPNMCEGFRVARRKNVVIATKFATVDLLVYRDFIIGTRAYVSCFFKYDEDRSTLRVLVLVLNRKDQEKYSEKQEFWQTPDGSMIYAVPYDYMKGMIDSGEVRPEFWTALCPTWRSRFILTSGTYLRISKIFPIVGVSST